MNILVTGGAGFIGSHVVDKYIEAGHRVWVIDNLSTGSEGNINPHAEFIRLDVADPQISDLLEKIKPQIVNHHAAQISVPISVKDPIKDAETNVIGLLNLLEACVKIKAEKFILISSGGAVYGEAEEYPTTESYEPWPLSPYAIHKFLGEKYLYYYRHQFGLKYTVL
ncbi:MAG: NAD-dependent epimerase/dehydratase family protein, partial [Candidatus Cloacimonetes bacterium]|nr:NAD-dependent epimerase/dehydratase family protein [Candidatus Cloacimonadota bacterium]